MDKAVLEELKKNLLSMKTQILNSGVMQSTDDLEVSSDDLADEADLASNVINQEVSFHIRHREMQKLRMIDEALNRIEMGQYGHCEECDEFIGKKRLMIQPWTTLCITHAEEQERQGQKFSKGA